MRYVRLAHEVEPDTPVGGKGRALAELTRAGLPVPAWAVVLPEAFLASLAPAARDAFERATDPAEARALAAEVRPCQAVAEELGQAMRALGPDGELVAVRSSAVDEDTAAHSFAGQLESFLFVGAAHLADRVARVWWSGFSQRLIAYRREAGLPPIPHPPAVLVQRMITPEVAGIGFSVDPVSARWAIAVVAANPGLASALVSGETTGDTWHVDREDRIVLRQIGDKHVVHRPDPGSVDGVRRETPPASEASRACLDDDGVRAVAALARRAERFFGRPQDIEWAMAGGQLYLLQSRPITTLGRKADPDSLRMIWDNSNIIESYSGVTTPLTFSFARRAYEEVYRQFWRLMRVPERVIAENADTFRCMLGLLNGRVYYNLLNWYRLVAMLPGYQSNRTFMEQMMGVRESLPEDLVPAARPGAGTRLRDAARLAGALWGLVAAYLGLDRRIRRFYERLDRTLGPGRPDLSARAPHQLVAYYTALEAQLLARWDAPIVNDFWTMVFHGLLRGLTRSWVGDAEGTLTNDLLCGERRIISTEPARRVREMASLVSDRPDLLETMLREPAAVVERTMALVPELERRYREYLDRFGDRCMEELKLESATLHDDPLPLLRAVGQYAVRLRAGETMAPEDHDAELRRRAEQRVREALRGHPVRRALFAWILANARARVRDRENLRLERTRVFGRARLILLELGRRLAALDRIDDPRDVFFLEVEELLSFVQGRATTTDLRGIAKVRQAEFARYREGTALPDRFETRGIAYVGNAFAAAVAAAPPGGEALKGIGCCAGVVRGRVRVVRNPRDAAVAPGEIVVAERTDPGWVMIFPSAAGLLVERGSLLSHSAIVARELGLPAIVALAGVTRWLKDGDYVEMDGTTGAVVKLADLREPVAAARA
jgi:pyruvate,water dikinase